MKHVYAYSALAGVEMRDVIHTTTISVTVATGISGEVIRRSDLDVPGARYFTTPRQAVEDFITKAEVALADATRKRHHAGWRDALSTARARLKELPKAFPCRRACS